jgi:ABC-type transport system substrate-binding protein
MLKKNSLLLSLGLMLVIVLIAAQCGGAPTAAPTEKPAEKPAESQASEAPKADLGTLKVGTEAAYPPFESKDEQGNFVGFDMDLMRAIGEAAGFKVEFIDTPFDGIFVALQSGQFDAVISAATITDERSKIVDFSDPYFDAGLSVIVKNDSTYKVVDDLKGKKIGVQLGTTGDMEATKLFGDANVRRYDDVLLMFQALTAGDVDGCVNDLPVNQGYVTAHPEANFRIMETMLTSEKYGIAINKDKPEVKAAINKGLAAVKASGKYDEIYKKNILSAAASSSSAATTPVTSTTSATATGKLLWNKNLKQAIAAAIDREALVDRVFEGRNTPAYSMVPQGYPYATEPFRDKYGTRNLDMAIELLKGLGYTEDKPFQAELWYPPEHYGTTSSDVMQVIKEQLEETKLIKVTLKSQNWAEYVDSFVAGKIPFFMLGWFPDFVDPENWLSPFASCKQSPDNGVFYCNEKMDQLLLSAASTSDTKKRESLYKEIGDLYADEVPTIPLFWEPEFITYRKGIEGIKIGPPFEFNYNVLSFTKDAKPASGKTDTIIIGTTDVVNSLDANDAYSTHDWEIIKNTGVPLLKYTPGTADLIPGTAEALPTVSDDGLSYTFKLKKGLTFADGTPLTAKDYVTSWNRINKLEGQVSGLVQLYVKDVEAPDDLTVVYHLTNSFGFFPSLAATAPFVVTNPKEFPADKIVQFPDKLDGTGPYRMVSYKSGEQLVLEANPKYFGADKPKIKNVIIRYIKDATTLGNAVETGQIDIAWRVVGPVEAVRLQKVEGLTVDTVNAPALRYLVFNHKYEAGAAQ